MARPKTARKKKPGAPAPTDETSAPEHVEPPKEPEPAGTTALAPTPAWARVLVVLFPFVAFFPSFASPILETWDDHRFILDEDVLHPSFSGLVSFFTEPRY